MGKASEAIINYLDTTAKTFVVIEKEIASIKKRLDKLEEKP